jgi:hypothetical protein
MTVVNPCPGFGHAQNCGGVKPPLLITGSPT